MPRRRPQLIPWKVAGRVTEQQASADEVVQATGWVFNNETGDTLTLAEFVATGDNEVPGLPRALRPDRRRRRPALARRDRLRHRPHDVRVHAPLRHGHRLRPRRRLPRALPGGRRPLRQGRPAAHGRGRRRPHAAASPTTRVDVAFSYITLQHCERDDALALVEEALRVVRPGGQIALNFRSWSGLDPFVLPIGVVDARPVPGARHRAVAVAAGGCRPASPGRPTGSTRTRSSGRSRTASPTSSCGATRPADAPLWGVKHATSEHFEGINRNHWWLVATSRRSP